MKSNIILTKRTSRTLQSTIPVWMETLNKINFDIIKASYIDKCNMERTSDKCFIGELHNGDGYYKDCLECKRLAIQAMLVFNFNNKTNAFLNSLDRKFEQTEDGVVKYLNYVARHIEKFHMDLKKK